MSNDELMTRFECRTNACEHRDHGLEIRHSASVALSTAAPAPPLRARDLIWVRMVSSAGLFSSGMRIWWYISKMTNGPPLLGYGSAGKRRTTKRPSREFGHLVICHSLRHSSFELRFFIRALANRLTRRTPYEPRLAQKYRRAASR